MSKPLSHFIIDQHLLIAIDLTAEPGSEALGLHNARLDYDQAFRLRNWLSDWLGQHGNNAVRTTLG